MAQDRRSRPEIARSEPPPASAAAAWDGEARARAKDARDLALEAAQTAREVAEGLRELVKRFGEPPAPGVPGTGLVGEFMQVGERLERLEDRFDDVAKQLDEVLATVRASSSRTAANTRRKWAGIAAVLTAVGTAGAAVAGAIRGSPPPPAAAPTPAVMNVEARERRPPPVNAAP